MGVSYFVYDEAVHTEFLDFAREHNKPVLLAEATSQGYDLNEFTYASIFSDGSSLEDKTAEEIWDEWYSPFFEYIYANADVIRGVAYINTDWNSQTMWEIGGGNGYWGDSRIEANDYIKERWLEEIGSDFWLHGSASLYSVLGFNN